MTKPEKVAYFFQKMEEFWIEFHDYTDDVENIIISIIS